MITFHGKDNVSGRQLLSLDLPDLTSYPLCIDIPGSHFILLLCADGRKLDHSAVIQFGIQAVSQGAVYFCVWGPGCERIHDLLDSARDHTIPDQDDETVIMSTWHDGESLAEAL